MKLPYEAIFNDALTEIVAAYDDLTTIPTFAYEPPDLETLKELHEQLGVIVEGLEDE